ncbi:MAG: hypothetical protein AB9856_06720 [Cellulosilyticaceae bacterium]
MYLRQIGKDKNRTTTRLDLEKVADDLLMVSFDNDINDQAQVFSYWRMSGNGGNPPLEVGVNTETGTIKSITFFVDSACFGEIRFSNENTLFGNILIDSSVFSKVNDYINNKGNYCVTLDRNKFLCRLDEKCDIKETVTNQNIEFHIDNNGQLRGFTIDNLTDLEIETIKSLL